MGMKTEDHNQTPSESAVTRDSTMSRDSSMTRSERYNTANRSAHHPIKRLREDSGTSVRSVDSAEAQKLVDYIKKVTILEMQVTKLKEDNEKLKIESEFKEQEKKQSSLRDDEEAKNSRDRIFEQRNSLYSKNNDLTEELECLSDAYTKFHKDMTEKHNALLGEVGDLKTKLLQVTDELFSERRRSSQELWLTTKKLKEEVKEKEIEIIKLQNDNDLKALTISKLTEDVDSISSRVSQLHEVQKSECQLRMELDTLKNKEIYASVFPDKILQSTQVHETNVRLQRDIKNLRDEKEYASLLKIQLEDTNNEIESLKKQLADYHSFKDQHDTLTGDLKDWEKVKSELNMTSPLSIISTVSKLQKDSLHMTSLIERYKSEVSSLTSELTELRAAHTDLETRAETDREMCSEIRKKLSHCEVKCAEYREEAASCKKLLETYQTTTEDDRQHLPRKAGLKIMHMKHNPYQDRLDSELKRLSADNVKLKQQLELAENSSVVKELEHCQKKLAESEAALKKTKTIYQSKVKEFKEGIFDMFGYSVTCPADKQYSLLSVFAESQDNNILFYRVNNNMQLMETRFTKTLDMQAHISKLTQHRCIPLFLSDVTSDLFHRQTVVGGELEYTVEFGGYNKR